jgi:hypothetical protein
MAEARKFFIGKCDAELVKIDGVNGVDLAGQHIGGQSSGRSYLHVQYRFTKQGIDEARLTGRKCTSECDHRLSGKCGVN